MDPYCIDTEDMTSLLYCSLIVVYCTMLVKVLKARTSLFSMWLSTYIMYSWTEH